MLLPGYPFAHAQLENIAFEHFTHEDGLSAPVTKIVQDNFDFILLGTMDGLNRFDGRNFAGTVTIRRTYTQAHVSRLTTHDF
jgi:hypothetical protein